MLNLQTLNDRQLEAVCHSSNHLLVLAGPGSGKTHTITQRIFYLIEEKKVPPDQILVITFTKDAAISMQNRFSSESNLVYPVNFGTFHSVFYQILRQSMNHSRLDNPFQIIRPYQKRNIAKKVLSSFMETQKAGSTYHESEIVDCFLQAVSYYKNTDDIEKSKLCLPDFLQVYFGDYLQAYLIRCKQQNLIDFDDMVFLCRNILRDNTRVWNQWNNRFQYILIDEFQDINPMQYEVIGYLTGNNTSVFAVGDDDQSIYGFRGAAPDCMKRFCSDYHADLINLRINYRSHPLIVQMASKMIAENRNRMLKEQISFSEEAGNHYSDQYVLNYYNTYVSLADVIFIYREETEMLEMKQVITILSDLKPDQTIAILFRTNISMQKYAAALTTQGISFVMEEKAPNIYEHQITKDIMAYLFLACGDNSQGYLSQIINKPVRYIHKEACLFQNTKQHISLLDPVKLFYLQGEDKNIQAKLKAINRLEKDLAFMKDKPLHIQISYIRRKIGYESYALNQYGTISNCIEILDFLEMDAKKYDELEEWVNAQKNLIHQKTDVPNSVNKSENKQIQLMTIHASKGLEFDSVIIPDVNDGNFPYGKMLDQETVEEERRIFYVAITRAKSKLYFIYKNASNGHKKEISRFMNPLLIEISNYVEKREKKK